MDGRSRIPARERGEALGVAVAGRSGIEHDAASERRLAAEYHAVAARGHDGLGQAKLRTVVSDPHDARKRVRGPDMSLHALAVADRLELLEHHVEPVRDGVRAGSDERIAAVCLRALDAREADRDALARLRPLDRAVVYLDAAYPHGSPRRLDAQLVARAERSGPEGPSDDSADPAQRERAIDVEAHRAVRPRLLDRIRRAPDRLAQLVEPCARFRADRYHLGARDELGGLRDRELERLLVDRVRLRHRDDPAPDVKQSQNREVLVCLGTRALAGVDDEQEEVDPGRARHHRPHEALVAGHVDDREPSPISELERRVAEVDRDPARLLLREPVGVLSGQRAHEPRLPVVNVAGRSDRQGHRARTRPSSIDTGSSPAPSSSARHCGSVRSRPPASVSMSRSSHFPPSGSFPGSMTVSVAITRAPGRAPLAIVRRIFVAASSSQSWMIPESTYASPGGTRSKKLPSTNSSFGPKALSSRSVSGRSNTIPRSPGRRPRSSTRSVPLPPPTSTTVSPSLQSSSASRSALRSLPPAIARSNTARSSGCALSHDQKSVPNASGNVVAPVRTASCRSATFL
jgi:hypothetical protein